MIRAPALEDEFGDVLEKALKLAGLHVDELARDARVDINRVKDALDYRSELTEAEVAAIARMLGLNERGLVALAAGHYPRPDVAIAKLPFRLDVLAMPYGLGVVNAYLVRHHDTQSAGAVLVDSGHCSRALERAWPPDAKKLSAHLVTHWDADHVGGCGETLARFNLPYCIGPGPAREGMRVVTEGERLALGGFDVQIFSTPGPAQEHLCYLISEQVDGGAAAGVLFAGDLFFCGSIGGGFYEPAAVLRHARRLWETLPAETVVAPGHGPLTTIGHERSYNPFSAP